MAVGGLSAKTIAAAIVIIALIATGYVLLAPLGGAGKKAVGEGGEIVIGFTYSATGQYSVIGQEYYKGAKLWEKYVNSQGGIVVGDKAYKVRIVAYDDKSDPDTVARIYNETLVREADFLLGPAVSPLAPPAIDAAERNGKIIMVATPGIEPFKFSLEYSYQVASPSNTWFILALETIKSLDPAFTSLAIIFVDSPFTRAMAQGAVQWASNNGVQVVFEYFYDPGTTDFSRVIRALAPSPPDVVIGGGGVAEGAALARALYDSGLPVKAVVLFQGVETPAFQEAAGDAVLGVMGVVDWYYLAGYSPFIAQQLNLTWYGPTITEFTTLYQQEYGGTPTAAAARAFAALVVLQYALETAGSLDTDQVRQALDNARLLTFYGPIAFDTNPETHGMQLLHRPLLVQWQPGDAGPRVNVVAPPEFANAQPIYPIPWQG